MQLSGDKDPHGASQETDNDELVLVPKANRKTFSIMAENYKARGLHNRPKKLWVAFKEAEIATHAFMMKQLLESYVLNGDPQGAREIYLSVRPEFC